MKLNARAHLRMDKIYASGKLVFCGYESVDSHDCIVYTLSISKLKVRYVISRPDELNTRMNRKNTKMFENLCL